MLLFRKTESKRFLYKVAFEERLMLLLLGAPQ